VCSIIHIYNKGIKKLKKKKLSKLIKVKESTDIRYYLLSDHTSGVGPYLLDESTYISQAKQK
jgi:hypothetical protein